MTNPSPTDELRADHAAATAAVRGIAEFVSALELSASTPWAASGEALQGKAEEVRGVLLLHFLREEEALFPEVMSTISVGAPKVDILSQFFTGEADDDLKAHTIMRSRIKELFATVEEARLGGAIGPDHVQRLRATIDLLGDILRRHITKEHTIIFPMIERLLDEQQVARVAERMGQIRQAV